MEEAVATHWEFGGWLRSYSPDTAFLILAAVLILAAGLTFWSYRRARQQLTVPRTVVLGLLRAGFLLAVVLCLANPTLVERKYLEGSDPGIVAVVVDHSASMLREDNRGNSRLDNGLRQWRVLENQVRESGRELEFYGFALSPNMVKTVDEAAKVKKRTEQTHLLSSLAKILNDAPAVGYEQVIVLTDGLDTTDTPADNIIKTAGDKRSAVSFLPADNRLRLQPFLRVREWTTPAQVMRRTAFQTEMVIEAYAEEDEALPIKLMKGDEVLDRTVLKLEAGRNVQKWSSEIQALEPETMDLRLATGRDDDPIELRARVDVVDKQNVRILYYQGALDWGYRYLADTLRRDPSFQLDSIFHAGPESIIANTNGIRSKASMPEKSHLLRPYQLLILSNVYPGQISKNQQKAILDYVRQGGGVLFLAPDAQAAQGFSGTLLEEILPVTFEPPGSVVDEAAETIAFQKYMWNLRNGANIPTEKQFAAQSAAERGVKDLTPFSFPDDTSPAFLQTHGANGTIRNITPSFLDYAKVRWLKPGAAALAVHPVDINPKTKEHRVLLATQQFGRGRSSVLTTDGLWRWKMRQPSESKEVETFWQQFLLWLAREPERMRFAGVPPMSVTGRSLTVTVEQPTPGGQPVVRIAGTLPGQDEVMNLTQMPGDPGTWSGTWTPAEDGSYMLTAARDASSPPEARHILQTRSEISEPLPDRAEAQPDRNLMTRLATATGGEMLAAGSLPAWLAPGQNGAGLPLAEHRRRLWNTGWLMALALAAYAAELLLRRYWRLL